jgi:hypothetical protein
MASRYTANRFLGGSLFFPLRLYCFEDRVMLERKKIFSSWERTIPLSRVASVSAQHGLVVGTVVVESLGGGEDIVASGFNKADIEQFRRQVEDAIS